MKIKNQKNNQNYLAAKDRDKERLKTERPQKVKKVKDKAAKTAQQTIPYKKIHIGNIMEVQTGKFSKTYEFQDINYQIAKQDDQEDIFIRYGEILNCLDTTVEMQINIINNHVSKDNFEDVVFLKHKQDGYDEYREEYNSMLEEKMTEGRNDLRRDKYITITVNASSLEEARQKFNQIQSDMESGFKKIGSELREVKSEEKVGILKDIFVGADTYIPKLSKSDYDKCTEKEYIAPDYFEFKKDYFMFNDKYARCVFVRDFPSFLNDRLIADLTDLGLNQVLTININAVEPHKALRLVKKQLTGMEANVIQAKKKAVQSGYTADLIPHDLQHSVKEAEELLDDLMSKNQKMFFVNVLVMHMADSYRQLNIDTDTIKSATRKYLCNTGVLAYQQEDAMKSSLPIGNCTLKSLRRTLTTESTAILMPFNTQEMIQKNGMYYGLNAVSKNMIMFNRKTMKNANGFILGTPGCFIGSTKVKLSDGQVMTLEEMANTMKHKEIWVNSYDLKNNADIKTQARDPRVTKHTKYLINVHLSNGETLTCTKDHKFLTRAGEYLQAEQLQAGQELMPIHTIVSTEAITLDEEVPVYDLTVDEYENFMLDCGIYVHNSGKSFSAKREMVNVLLNTDDDVIIIDPEREYTPLAENFDGEIIHISASSKNFINPLDMSENYADDEEPIILKSEFILSLCESIIGGRYGLSTKAKAIIDRCLRMTYRDYMADFNPEKVPTLHEFYKILKEQPEEEAQELAVSLELYVTGSLGIFANKTNVDYNKRLVVYDIKDLGKQLKTMGLLIVLDNVWNKITENRAAGKSTWIYIDEIYLLFANEYSANFLFELYKRARKWGGIPTGITQNVEDLLQSELARRMLSNSDFIQMLNQATSDRKELANLLNISDTQLSFVTNSNAGQGLLFCGNSIIPFVDQFPKNTKLYSMMTTNLAEMERK